VLDRVGVKTKSVLNTYDRKPLSSGKILVRWKNTAQWCRNTLVREGLMKSDSAHDVWEISEIGRKRLPSESSQ
jgi:oligoribonuclease NrnB/cAMP/cGMP phosphodiesterase (DHH superfamily)